jgi:plasmid stabilization system protein ParE
MDYEAAYSPEALGDGDAIAEYIARDSDFYAQAVVTEIIEVSRALTDFRFAGRVVSELEQYNLRERFI